MEKILHCFPGFVIAMVLATGVLTSAFDQNRDWAKASSVFDFHANDIDSHNVNMDKYRGTVSIVVNVASKCGLTDRNYKQLQRLYNDYQSKGLRIVAFPCNQFSNQEPGTPEEIKEFVAGYGVTFDVMEKIDVNGENAHPLYRYLKSKVGNNADIEWNFAKFLVDQNGQIIDRYHPHVNPDDMEQDIRRALGLH